VEQKSQRQNPTPRQVGVSSVVDFRQGRPHPFPFHIAGGDEMTILTMIAAATLSFPPSYTLADKPSCPKVLDQSYAAYVSELVIAAENVTAVLCPNSRQAILPKKADISQLREMLGWAILAWHSEHFGPDNDPKALQSLYKYSMYLVPPKEFDFEPKKKPIVVYSKDIQGACGKLANACSTNGGTFTCLIILPMPNEYPSVYAAALLRHEKAHCNGWRHPGPPSQGEQER
jgi:hypothetical protein